MVDGMDGSGKSTVAGWIREYYEGQGDRVHVQVHPSDRWAGRMARRALQSRGMVMYAVSTLFFILDVIISVMCSKRWARKYDDIIFVRYLMATAYLPMRYAPLGYRVFSTVLPVPERLLLVDVAPEVALRRIAHREDKEEMFENLPELERCRKKLMILSQAWKVLDNNRPEKEARSSLLAQLEEWDRTCESSLRA